MRLAELFDAHAAAVFRAVSRLGVVDGDVDDVVHEVFLVANRQLRSFERRSLERTWLLGIAIRCAANARRSARRQRVKVAALHLELLPQAPGPDEAAEHRQGLERLRRAIQRLPDEQREVVVLVNLEQLTGREASELLGVNLNTVYSRLRLAHAALLDELSKGQR